MPSIEEVMQHVVNVPNYPKPGVVFKDITPVLANAEAFRWTVSLLSDLIPEDVDRVFAIESRGFILGAALADRRGWGMALARKKGKLPRATWSQSYSLEYGQDEIEVHQDAMRPNERVVIVDDVLATGGTAQAVEALCDKAQVKVVRSVFFLELGFLNGRDRLRYPAASCHNVID